MLAALLLCAAVQPPADSSPPLLIADQVGPLRTAAFVDVRGGGVPSALRTGPAVQIVARVISADEAARLRADAAAADETLTRMRAEPGFEVRMRTLQREYQNEWSRFRTAQFAPPEGAVRRERREAPAVDPETDPKYTRYREYKGLRDRVDGAAGVYDVLAVSPTFLTLRVEKSAVHLPLGNVVVRETLAAFAERTGAPLPGAPAGDADPAE